jgi:DNA-binding Lrp family transcriptional regulator
VQPLHACPDAAAPSRQRALRLRCYGPHIAALDEDLLRAVRSAPDSTLAELADAVGLPRTNFGRSVNSRLRAPLRRLLDDGLIEERGSRYRISADGRRLLAARALGLSD